MYKLLAVVVAFVSADQLADSIARCQRRILATQSQWQEDCLEKCSHYAINGIAWCPGADTDGQVLLDCIEKLHGAQCEVLPETTEDPMTNVEYCQSILGHPTNKVYDEDCKAKCEWYHDNGEPWCQGVSSDREILVECVLHYQTHCVKV